MAGPRGPAFLLRVTHPFEYRAATSIEHAARELTETGAVPLGGGTDLLVAIEERIVAPGALVDLRSIPGGGDIAIAANGSATIGATARISDLAKDDRIRDRFPALAQACDVVATPALRHMGTIGGNLCQRPRCWYFRRGISCFKSGGSSCPAKDGENQYLAILDGGPCWAVHPSDPAVALTALDASVVVSAANGTRVVALADFYTLPIDRADRETVLEAGEFVSAIRIPGASSGGVQFYHKLMQRDAWDFALVSIAACKRADGEVRIVLGGVAPRPWRVNSSVEEDASSGGLDEEAIATLADRALLDAAPLSKNSYKVDLAASLLRQVLAEIA
jgi:xanthine dehydrogenase YagS FAD-binding subunit